MLYNIVLNCPYLLLLLANLYISVLGLSLPPLVSLNRDDPTSSFHLVLFTLALTTSHSLQDPISNSNDDYSVATQKIRYFGFYPLSDFAGSSSACIDTPCCRRHPPLSARKENELALFHSLSPHQRNIKWASGIDNVRVLLGFNYEEFM